MECGDSENLIVATPLIECDSDIQELYGFYIETVKYQFATTILLLDKTIYFLYNSCMNEWTFIYALGDPDTGAARYVGKADVPQQRYNNHIYESRFWGRLHDAGTMRSEPTAKQLWVYSLLNNNKKPRLYIIEACTSDRWREREALWIKRLNEQGNQLVNRDNSGRPIK